MSEIKIGEHVSKNFANYVVTLLFMILGSMGFDATQKSDAISTITMTLEKLSQSQEMLSENQIRLIKQVSELQESKESMMTEYEFFEIIRELKDRELIPEFPIRALNQILFDIREEKRRLDHP